ncbi:MAG TPA: ATP-binding cassette domain-containing protein [Thermoplasmata archaeon]|nr:ATP-binding cassette domain-containing protein [Thermoplasmata archaeon]
MADMIVVDNLVEVYAGGTKAVDGVSFRVPEGEFFGFLGPNGAGKSTTIKVLSTLLRKTSGAVTIGGQDLDRDPDGIRRIIGVQSQETVVDGDLTGRKNLVFQGHLQRMQGPTLRRRVDELLDLMELRDVADRKAKQYSGGMKRRLSLAAALVHRPRLVFLDEPTTGLDPQSRAKVWSYLSKLNEQEGTTVFLTTQYLEEADKLCRQLSIIDHGKIVASGSPADLKEEIGGETIILTLDPDIDPGPRGALEVRLRALPGVGKVVRADSGLVVYARQASRLVEEIVTLFQGVGIHPESISLAAPTLDDVFLQKTGSRIRQGDLVSGAPPPSVSGVRGGAY